MSLHSKCRYAVCHNRIVSAFRNRALFIGLIILLLALMVLRTALHLAGGAIRVILLIAIVLVVVSWATSVAGKGRR